MSAAAVSLPSHIPLRYRIAARLVLALLARWRAAALSLLNGRRKGVVEGTDFAAAVFAIWLGPKPIDVSLKSQLLTCS